MIEIRLVFNRKGKIRKDGTALIQWCLSFNRRYKYLSSKIRIEPKYWDYQLSKVNRKHPGAGVLNRQLREQQSKIEDLEDELIKSQKEV